MLGLDNVHKHLLYQALMLLYIDNWLPRGLTNAPSLSVFKRQLDNALNNMLKLLINTEVVRQLD